MKKSLVVLILLFIGLFVCFSVGYKKGHDEALITFDTYKAGIVEETLHNNPPPQCFMSNCPEYDFFDIDGDGLTESVVTEYTAMTQQAGRIWIIDKGRVVFKSDERAQIGVEPREDSDSKTSGFIVLYNTTFQLSPTFLDSFRSDYYIFKDGKFVLEKTNKRSYTKSK